MTLQHGLSVEPDEQLAERAQGGDEGALDQLIGRYRHYARSKARSFFLIGADKEDIVQEGMIGLFKAIRDFRPQKNSTFGAFAELCISRQIITAIKGATRQKHIPLNSYVSLNRQVHPGAVQEPRTLDESLLTNEESDPAELVVSAEEIASIRQSITRTLSELEIEVLELYMDGKSYQEIAGMLGRHVKSIDNALQRIKRKLEHFLIARKEEVIG